MNIGRHYNFVAVQTSELEVIFAPVSAYSTNVEYLSSFKRINVYWMLSYVEYNKTTWLQFNFIYIFI
jgi:hypothetical protein